MAQPSYILDGSMAYGTTPIVLNGVTYKINKITITPQWTEAEDFNSTGGPQRKRWTKGRYKAAMELQLADSTTAFPPSGTTFTLTIPNETSAVPFVILETPVEQDNSASSIRVVNVTAESTIGTVTTVA